MIFEILMPLLTFFLVKSIAIPSIVKIADIKHFFDEPYYRNILKIRTLVLESVVIFTSSIIFINIWSNHKEIIEIHYILCFLIVTLFIVIKYDLLILVVYKKMLGNIIASFIFNPVLYFTKRPC